MRLGGRLCRRRSCRGRARVARVWGPPNFLADPREAFRDEVLAKPCPGVQSGLENVAPEHSPATVDMTDGDRPRRLPTAHHRNECFGKNPTLEEKDGHSWEQRLLLRERLSIRVQVEGFEKKSNSRNHEASKKNSGIHTHRGQPPIATKIGEMVDHETQLSSSYSFSWARDFGRAYT